MIEDGSNLPIIKCYAWRPWGNGEETLIIIQEFDGKYEREIYRIKPDGEIIHTISLPELHSSYRYPVCIGHFDAAAKEGTGLTRIF